MGTLLKGGTVVELEPALVEVADLRIEGAQIVARGVNLAAAPGDEVIDLKGKVVMPGLVCAHHHLYSALSRGMPPPAQAPDGFQEILERVWWRLDQALDLDGCQVSATVGALEALGCGTTTIVDHHASPRAIAGSLVRIARGLNDVGLRGLLCYEVTDRHGAVGREEGIEETVAFIRKAKGRFRGMVGAHAAFTLSQDALAGLAEAMKATGAGFHIHLAEDPSDERISFQRYGDTPVNRLAQAGLLTPKTIVAHAVHLSWPELSQVISTGAWIIHNPRSNMNNQVGYAPAGKFGARATLGTDGIGADMFAEAKLAHFRARDAGQPIDVLRYLTNGHRLASQMFDAKIGPMREGAVADLIVLDYRTPTPLTTENLSGHFLFGFDSRFVEASMIDGVWRMWARRPLSVNPEAIHEEAKVAAAALWARAALVPAGTSRGAPVRAASAAPPAAGGPPVLLPVAPAAAPAGAGAPPAPSPDAAPVAAGAPPTSHEPPVLQAEPSAAPAEAAAPAPAENGAQTPDANAAAAEPPVMADVTEMPVLTAGDGAVILAADAPAEPSPPDAGAAAAPAAEEPVPVASEDEARRRSERSTHQG